MHATILSLALLFGGDISNVMLMCGVKTFGTTIAKSVGFWIPELDNYECITLNKAMQVSHGEVEFVQQKSLSYIQLILGYQI